MASRAFNLIITVFIVFMSSSEAIADTGHLTSDPVFCVLPVNYADENRNPGRLAEDFIFLPDWPYPIYLAPDPNRSERTAFYINSDGQFVDHPKPEPYVDDVIIQTDSGIILNLAMRQTRPPLLFDRSLGHFRPLEEEDVQAAEAVADLASLPERELHSRGLPEGRWVSGRIQSISLDRKLRFSGPWRITADDAGMILEGRDNTLTITINDTIMTYDIPRIGIGGYRYLSKIPETESFLLTGGSGLFRISPDGGVFVIPGIWRESVIMNPGFSNGGGSKWTHTGYNILLSSGSGIALYRLVDRKLDGGESCVDAGRPPDRIVKLFKPEGVSTRFLQSNQNLLFDDYQQQLLVSAAGSIWRLAGQHDFEEISSMNDYLNSYWVINKVPDTNMIAINSRGAINIFRGTEKVISLKGTVSDQATHVVPVAYNQATGSIAFSSGYYYTRSGRLTGPDGRDLGQRSKRVAQPEPRDEAKEWQRIPWLGNWRFSTANPAWLGQPILGRWLWQSDDSFQPIRLLNVEAWPQHPEGKDWQYILRENSLGPWIDLARFEYLLTYSDAWFAYDRSLALRYLDQPEKGYKYNAGLSRHKPPMVDPGGRYILIGTQNGLLGANADQELVELDCGQGCKTGGIGDLVFEPTIAEDVIIASSAGLFTYNENREQPIQRAVPKILTGPIGKISAVPWENLFILHAKYGHFTWSPTEGLKRLVTDGPEFLSDRIFEVVPETRTIIQRGPRSGIRFTEFEQ